MSASSPPSAPPPDPVERLLARAPGPEYLAAWSRALEHTLFQPGTADDITAVVFRLGEEHYALDTASVREVHRPRAPRRVPGRSNDVFRGLVCLRGELLLCANLHALLGAPRTPLASDTELHRRVLVLERHREGVAERWAVEVDEVLEVARCDRARLKPVQVTVAKAAVHFSDAVLDLGTRHASRLDPGRLFAGLGRSLA